MMSNTDLQSLNQFIGKSFPQMNTDKHRLTWFCALAVFICVHLWKIFCVRLACFDRKAFFRRSGSVTALLCCLTVAAQAQLLRKSDYGVGVTIALYQFDDARSKPFSLVNTLKITANTPEEEVDYITKTFGVEDLKVRHIRSVGLKEGESFTDTQPMNERQLVFTITPRLVGKAEITFDFIAKYDEKTLLEMKSVTAASYETVMLRGERGEFGVREFMGPNGPEKAPEKRALLVTITPSVQSSRSLANKPSDISRPTDQYGSKQTLEESDVFTMPAVINRMPLKFAAGSSPKGSITLEGIITPEGRVTNVKILDTPDPALNPKAIEAFRQYRFNPAKINGRPTYATFRETIILAKQGPL
jgi:TonB family protein